jgi:hypothetical protein
MKNLIYFFFIVCLGTVIFSCAKDEQIIDASEVNESIEVDTRNNDVCLCHKNDGNNPKIICINENAVAAHLAHGDVLLIDDDGDGYVTNDNNCGLASGDCNDDDASINPGAEEELCDGIDNDCNPDTEDNPDGDGDGVGVCDDCDDNDANNYPGNEEVCGDGQDNDCDGEVDEGCFGNCTLCNFIDELLECNTCWMYTDEFGCGDLGLFTECAGNGYVNVDGCDWGCNSPFPGVPTTAGDAESNANCEEALKAALPACSQLMSIELSEEMKIEIQKRIAQNNKDF